MWRDMLKMLGCERKSSVDVVSEDDMKCAFVGKQDFCEGSYNIGKGKSEPGSGVISVI